MKIMAYCIAPAVKMVRAATGVAPLTSPPWTAELLRPEMLEGFDLLYFRLHGLPSNPSLWLGEGHRGDTPVALTAANLEGVDLGGATVVVANCYGAESLMVQELYEARAGAVIAGYGPNLAAKNMVVGVDRLVQWVIKGLRMGLSAAGALRLAKVRLAATAWRRSDWDAMQFRLMYMRRLR